MIEKNNHIANGLPKGWKWVKVSSVAELFRGINYTKDVASNIPLKDSLPILRANNINSELNFEDLVYVPKSLIKKEQLIKRDDIVFAMSSGSKHLVGKSAVAKDNFDGSFGAFCALLRISDEVNKKYVSYVFKGNSYRKLISEIAKGININNLKREHILDFEFPLPPKRIQNLIVSKIEELFSELDKGIEQLKTAQQQLKIYRQAVLKAAFEGKLTSHKLPLAGVEPIAMAAEAEEPYGNNGKLPEGWKWSKFNEIGRWTGGGTPSKQNKSFWENGNVIWVSPKDMKSKIIVDTEDKITPNSINHSSAKLIKKGSILFVVRSGIIRRILPIAIAGKDLTTNQDLQSLILNEGYIPEYVYWYCISQESRIREKCAKDGTTVDNIEVPKLKSYPICVCSNNQQKQIVQEIESRLSVADKMEEAIDESLQQAEALRQSILKKAFEGKLI